MNPIKKLFNQEAFDPMDFDKYQSVLSEKTRALMTLDAQKRELESKENRKQQLIAAIGEASAQVDQTDSDAEKLKGDIAAMQRELNNLEASLSKEQKVVYAQAQKILNNRIELAKKFNALIDEVHEIWRELGAEIDQNEALVLRTAFDVSRPVDLGQTFDFNFNDLPLFCKYPNSNQVQATTRYQGSDHAL
ncbi:hypothetical protein [Leptolyngbya sp. FACHB-17]|uniref:hypothetical protein n=1 Tax=unclassified Leptolyngbya TaxID=2650499 RepID=UPI00168044D3|nr:hypothetical protein [Leptolyngbya sp. FACHB-17]MBD2083361.1 hypothetical protein [Leptolyngbya sp. FACHB-17]